MQLEKSVNGLLERFFFFSRGSLPIANIVRSRINKNKTYTINKNLKLGKNTISVKFSSQSIPQYVL